MSAHPIVAIVLAVRECGDIGAPDFYAEHMRARGESDDEIAKMRADVAAEMENLWHCTPLGSLSCRRFESEWGGKCRGCGERIEPGERISYRKEIDWPRTAHLRCEAALLAVGVEQADESDEFSEAAE